MSIPNCRHKLKNRQGWSVEEISILKLRNIGDLAKNVGKDK